MNRLPHSWCNVHETKPTSLDELPSDCDTFEAVAAEEEHSLAYFNRNLYGNTIMTNITNPVITNDTAAHLLPAGTVQSNAHYFDLIEDVVERITNPTFRARVTSSMAWLLDNQCIYMARVAQGVLYRDRDTDYIDYKFSEFALELGAVIKSEDWYTLDNEVGHEEAHPLASLSQLLALRDDWHNEAASAAAGDNRDYTPKDFDQLILAERARDTSLETREKYELLLKRRADYDDMKRAQRLTAMVERDRKLAEERLAQDRDNMGFTLIILDEASKHNTSSRFDMLAKRTQRSLTMSVCKMISRVANDDLAKQRSISVIEYGDILDEHDAVIDHLHKVLETRLADETTTRVAGSHRPQSMIDNERDRKAQAAAQ